MLRLFISYSHVDEELIRKFINHLTPLKTNGLIHEWYDRRIETGREYLTDIDNNLSNADLICLMISDNFLSSQACLNEKDEALRLRNEKGIRVIPIILSSCAWNLHKELNVLLATPTDGKPISSFPNRDDGWLAVVTSIKNVCSSVGKIKKLNISSGFDAFLNSAEILSKSHSTKDTLHLNDIYVPPKLKQYNGEENLNKYDSQNLHKDVVRLGKIIIAGENQSGKTTLCKVLFRIYRELNFIPVYLYDENRFLGNPHYKLEKVFLEQYDAASLEEYDSSRIVPIIDNFHFAKHQEKYVEQFAIYANQVIIVDDIFGLDIKNQNLIKEYCCFKIREYTAVERNELIKKWIQIKEEANIEINPNSLQKSLDEKSEMIDSYIGVIFGKGIMPSYPFFILSLLSAQETFKPLDSEITSQGHCYQALIYLFLRKEGVSNDQIDIHSNFLTELAFWIYINNGRSLNDSDFEEFLRYYVSKFNLPIQLNEILKVLSKVNICKFDSFNEFNFCYSYIYYFFVAKYLSEHIDTQQDIVNGILSNLHKDENAYITIFISHHTKSNSLLDELLLDAEILFENFQPSTLDSDELSFFDKHAEKIVQAILPSYQHDPKQERAEMLKRKADVEDRMNDDRDHSHSEDNEGDESELLTNLRLSIKTVEVMGMIIKNRSGSLDLNRLQYIYEQGLKVHLRIVSSFIEFIRQEETEQDIIDFIKERINKSLEESEVAEGKTLGIEQIEKIARTVFWNLNFGVIHGFITKAIHSLGSSNLLSIAEKISNQEKTPSAFIVCQGINMWYGKNLKIDEIASRINESDFSKTAERLIKWKIVEHCMLHHISYKDMQRVEAKLHLETKRILGEKAKGK